MRKYAKEPVETSKLSNPKRHEGGLPRAVARAVRRVLILGTFNRYISGWCFGIVL